jgi:hypothetical protein
LQLTPRDLDRATLARQCREHYSLRCSSHKGWSRLLKRVFDIDPENPQNWGGESPANAAIFEGEDFERSTALPGRPRKGRSNDSRVPVAQTAQRLFTQHLGQVAPERG